MLAVLTPNKNTSARQQADIAPMVRAQQQRVGCRIEAAIAIAMCMLSRVSITPRSYTFLDASSRSGGLTARMDRMVPVGETLLSIGTNFWGKRNVYIKKTP